MVVFRLGSCTVVYAYHVHVCFPERRILILCWPVGDGVGAFSDEPRQREQLHPEVHLPSTAQVSPIRTFETIVDSQNITAGLIPRGRSKLHDAFDTELLRDDHSGLLSDDERGPVCVRTDICRRD